jgi:hypothetical protein
MLVLPCLALCRLQREPTRGMECLFFLSLAVFLFSLLIPTCIFRLCVYSAYVVPYSAVYSSPVVVCMADCILSAVYARFLNCTVQCGGFRNVLVFDPRVAAAVCSVFEAHVQDGADHASHVRRHYKTVRSSSSSSSSSSGGGGVRPVHARRRGCTLLHRRRRVQRTALPEPHQLQPPARVEQFGGVQRLGVEIVDALPVLELGDEKVEELPPLGGVTLRSGVAVVLQQPAEG